MQFQHPPLQYNGRATTPPLYMGRSETLEVEQQQPNDFNFNFMFPRPSVASNRQIPSSQQQHHEPYNMNRTPMAQLPNPHENVNFQQNVKKYVRVNYAEAYGSIQVPHSRGSVVTPLVPPQTISMQLPPGSYHQNQANDLYAANSSVRPSSRNASPAAQQYGLSSVGALHAPMHPPSVYFPSESNSAPFGNSNAHYPQQQQRQYEDDSVQQSLQSMCTKMEADRQRLLQLEREEATLDAEEAAIRLQLLQLDERQQRANDRGQQHLQDWPTLFKMEQWVNETPDLDLSMQVAQLENRCAPLRHRFGQRQQEIHSHTVELQRFEGNDFIRQRVEDSIKQILETGKKVEQRAVKVKRICERFYDAEVQRTRAAKRHMNSVEDALGKVEWFLSTTEQQCCDRVDDSGARSKSAVRSLPPHSRAGSTNAVNSRAGSINAPQVQPIASSSQPDPTEIPYKRAASVGATPAAAPVNMQRSRLVSFGPSPAVPPRPKLIPSIAPAVPGDCNFFPEASFCVALDDDDEDDPFPVALKPKHPAGFMASVGLADDESVAYPLQMGARSKAGR